MIVNLLTNAIQHGTDEPVVTVSVTEHDGTVRVRVADNGPGVPDEQKELIFQQGAKRLGSPGAGIGLYLVETVIEGYGGSVQVTDNEPTGAVFELQLPVWE